MALVSAAWLAGCTPSQGTSRLCEPAGSTIGQPRADGPQRHALDSAPVQVDDGWPVSTLQVEGIAPGPIAGLLDEIDGGGYTKVDSVLIARHGKLVLEAYFNGFDRTTKHDTRSAFKSFTSTLAGIAIDQGHIRDVDVPISSFYPDYWPDMAGDRDLKNRITLAHLLTMTPGYAAEEGFGIGPYREGDLWKSADWVRFSLDLPMSDPPGTQFSYASSTTFLIGDVVSRAASEPLTDFARKHLFAPLGITHYCWSITPKGRAVAQGSFFMRPRDMLKLGQLFLDDGVWQDRQLVPKDWVKTASSHLVDALPPDPPMPVATTRGYGYQWWTTRARVGEDPRVRTFFASGNGGQKIFVFPDLDMVVVFTGSNYNKPAGHRQPAQILKRFILPSVL